MIKFKDQQKPKSEIHKKIEFDLKVDRIDCFYFYLYQGVGSNLFNNIKI